MLKLCFYTEVIAEGYTTPCPLLEIRRGRVYVAIPNEAKPCRNVR
jgi:hypothetical protein